VLCSSIDLVLMECTVLPLVGARIDDARTSRLSAFVYSLVLIPSIASSVPS
jgi:hypothetical protein